MWVRAAGDIGRWGNERARINMCHGTSEWHKMVIEQDGESHGGGEAEMVCGEMRPSELGIPAGFEQDDDRSAPSR